MIWRILWLLPVPLMLAFFFGEVINRPTSRFKLVSRVWYPLIPLILILLGTSLLQLDIKLGLEQLKASKEDSSVVESLNGTDILKYLREHGQPGSTIITPSSWLANEIPGIVGHSYGITFRMAPPLFEEASQDQNVFYQSHFVTTTHLDILEKYKIKYIILKVGTPLGDQFRRLPTMFRPLYVNLDYELYEWDAKPLTEVEMVIIEGNQYHQHGDLLMAGMSYIKAMELEPHPLAAIELGRLYLRAKMVEEALAVYQQAIAVTPDDPWLHFYQGEAYTARSQDENGQGSYQEALASYRQAFSLAPDNRSIRRAFIQAYQNSAEDFDASLLDEVVKAYERDIQHNPDEIQNYWNLAEVYQILEWQDKAMAVYMSAIARWPDSAETYLYLGQIHEARNEIDAAIANYQQVIKLDPMITQVYILLGNLYRDQERIDEAITLYQAAAQRHYSSAWPHVELGKIYLDNIGE
jgi:tetratricopeptide (TPR) repeat protein